LTGIFGWLITAGSFFIKYFRIREQFFGRKKVQKYRTTGFSYFLNLNEQTVFMNEPVRNQKLFDLIFKNKLAPGL